ncbi:class I SAM-dependent methyltransferase [Methylolobus aquaticus]|nr:class I SAM-dependent methyltransferase [Methylolobus aquaticus]
MVSEIQTALTAFAIELMERGLLPETAIRAGIRRLLRQRLAELAREGTDGQQRLLKALSSGPIAVHTDTANAQHYEVPATFFEHVLGPHLKYSSGFWPEGIGGLAAAESAMLKLSCDHAAIENGMDVLELGCGWGSLTLWMAQQYPEARIVAMSNSDSQRRWIDAQAAGLGLSNIECLTADINDFDCDRAFDRIISVEMFEHARNYRLLLQQVAGWLRPKGKLFVHVFAHRDWAYRFGAESTDDWMGRYFFTGGTMPSHALLPTLAAPHLTLEGEWRLNGQHYQRTLEAWRQQHEEHRNRILPVFRAVYGTDAQRWWQRWRIFFIACSELFGYRNGEEWGVSHYRFARPSKER